MESNDYIESETRKLQVRLNRWEEWGERVREVLDTADGEVEFARLLGAVVRDMPEVK